MHIWPDARPLIKIQVSEYRSMKLHVLIPVTSRQLHIAKLINNNNKKEASSSG
jgi:hypothetical protein